jgi:hypothetical protein
MIERRRLFFRRDFLLDSTIPALSFPKITLPFTRVFSTNNAIRSYWPTPYGTENDPVVAEQMNNLPKVVFSSTNVGAIGLRQQL